MKLEEYVNAEKSFLHDISNSLVVLDSIARHLQNHEMMSSDLLSEKDKDKIQKLTVVVDKIISGVQNRKADILAHQK